VHLANNRVAEGDLFLFFGWFTQSYARNAPELHLIFGWLEVGEVWRLGQRRPVALPEYAHDHPHAVRLPGPNNTIYAARRGSAFARFDKRLRLTERGGHRSVWRLPSWFYPDNRQPLSYHEDRTRWTLHDDHVTLRTVGRGQEFVLGTDDYPEAAAWANAILAVPIG
jgi:hypothetical protein